MKQGQKNPRNIVEAVNILQTQLYSLSFSMNTLSKDNSHY